MSNTTPGYLTTLFEQGSYLGGIMITNEQGFPVDFKYTEPVVPTKVQRIIYGSVLEQYIRNHVIIRSMVKELDQTPSFYIVSQHQIHDIADDSGLVLVSVQRTQFSSLGEKGTVTRSKENECLLQGWTDPHPLRVVFGAMPSEQQESVLKELIHLSRHMDVVEPLERLEKALKNLCLEKSQD